MCVCVKVRLLFSSTTMWACADSRPFDLQHHQAHNEGLFCQTRQQTLFKLHFDFIVVLAWECNHVVSSVAELSCGLQRWTTIAGLFSFQEHIWVISRSNCSTQKGILMFHPVRKGTALSKQQPTTGTKHIGRICSLASTTTKAANLCYCDFTNVTLKTRMHT